MGQRGVAPVVGVTVLVLITVVLAALVGGMAFGSDLEDPPGVAITAEADYSAGTGQTHVEFTHVAGDALDAEDLDVRVSLDGEALDYQPPVPFFSATGFESGPTGPFNSGSSDARWSAGERAGFTIAGSNDPVPSPGEEITVRILVDGYSITTVKTVVR